jgi:RNA polymerase sigma factor (sigma-70 family)
VGQLSAQVAPTNEFFVSQFGTLFVNATYLRLARHHGDQSSERRGRTYPLATPGIRLKIAPNDQCYLRALRHFDTLRNSDVKPWLFAILRNVCRVEYARRSRVVLYDVNAELDKSEEAEPLWSEAPETPETTMIRKLDAATIQRLVAALPDPFREVIVLREINDLSYRDIAEVVGAPVGTVMSRLARARSILRTAWLAEGQLT